MSTIRGWAVPAAAAAAFLGLVAFALAQSSGDPGPPPSLKTVPVPEPPNLREFVASRQAAILLGKALYWDMQVGSDGVVACASCHFHAGADSRSINQVSPGLRYRHPDHPPLDPAAWGANAHLAPEHFPLRRLSDPEDRASEAVIDSAVRIASQGVFHAEFVRNDPTSSQEQVVRTPDPDGFTAGGLNVRRVEPRNTPSVINAVFNHRNFWDGRAQNEFNGLNEWGDRDPDARVFRAGNGTLEAVRVRLVDSSLASQAVAPLVSALEMAADGRTVPDVGNKLARKRGRELAPLRPLAGQLVHPQDSVLGRWSRWPHPGLTVQSYEMLIKKAFRPEWWRSELVIRVAENGAPSVVPPKPRHALAANEFTQMQYNFSLFFGLALQLYQATLVSDDTPYDRWREGRGALSPEALLGLAVFLGQEARVLPDGTRRAGARCINCHAGPEFTDASVSSIGAQGVTRNREGQDLDRGWNNIGVRPTGEDLGIGAKDPFGRWLSITRREPISERYIAVDGAFKAPGLRNVELTAPYFHNGGHLTLESVVAFYSRGGDFAPLIAVDGTEIRPLSVPAMSAGEQAAVVAFLKSLTDERVRYRRAPFDHPQLFVPNGQLNDHVSTLPDPQRTPQALDRMVEIPAVGRLGGPPLPNFLE
jgi:cytochrome c peroxidase